jgi:hypothetical protein
MKINAALKRLVTSGGEINQAVTAIIQMERSAVTAKEVLSWEG